MEQLTDLKAILHSKRANIYYLEHCRVRRNSVNTGYLLADDVDASGFAMALPCRLAISSVRLPCCLVKYE